MTPKLISCGAGRMQAEGRGQDASGGAWPGCKRRGVVCWIAPGIYEFGPLVIPVTSLPMKLKFRRQGNSQTFQCLQL